MIRRENKAMKVITHNDEFHADDVFAVAFLKRHFEFDSVERRAKNKPVTEQEYNDPSIFVLDTGGRLSPMYRCYDHHQDREIESTNVLVLNTYGTVEEKNKLSALFSEISAVDRGVKRVTTLPRNHVSRLISNMNNLGIMDAVDNKPDHDTNFVQAVHVACGIIDAYMESRTNEVLISGEMLDAIPLLRRASEETQQYSDYILEYYTSLEKVDGLVIETNGTFIPNWKEYAKKDGNRCMLSPNLQNAGQWQLVSYDSELFRIPATDSQTFRHPTGFMAVYATKADALAHYATL